ncbi:hypothetical protein Tco_1420028 [Tanacetum coccineum]
MEVWSGRTCFGIEVRGRSGVLAVQYAVMSCCPLVRPLWLVTLELVWRCAVGGFAGGLVVRGFPDGVVGCFAVRAWYCVSYCVVCFGFWAWWSWVVLWRSGVVLVFVWLINSPCCLWFECALVGLSTVWWFAVGLVVCLPVCLLFGYWVGVVWLVGAVGFGLPLVALVFGAVVSGPVLSCLVLVQKLDVVGCGGGCLRVVVDIVGDWACCRWYVVAGLVLPAWDVGVVREGMGGGLRGWCGGRCFGCLCFFVVVMVAVVLVVVFCLMVVGVCFGVVGCAALCLVRRRHRSDNNPVMGEKAILAKAVVEKAVVALVALDIKLSERVGNTECELMEPGFELIAWKWVEIRTFSFNFLSRDLLLLWVIEEDVGGGDVERLGTELERLTYEYAMLGCKVEGCGGVCVPRLR